MSTREPPRTHPRIAGTRTVHEGWARYLVAELEAADGARFHREIEDHGRAACVLPYDPQARVAVLVEQFRAPVLLAGGPPSLVEAPAGALEADDVEAEVRREAYEEAGLRLGPLERVASAWTMPGVSTERMDLFLAAFSAADRAGAGGGLAEEHEEITVHDVPLVDLAAMSDRGEITDLKTLTLVLALRLRHPDLFGGG